MINSTSIDGSSDVNVGDRTNRLSGNLYSAQKNQTLYLNTADFQAQNAGTLGNEARNSLYGPHYRHMDMSLIKDFPIREAMHVEFRAEAFNVTNVANFATPNATLETTSNFGTISATSAAYTARLLQFALKLAF